MNVREMIEERCQREGYTLREWDEGNENGLTAKLGRFEVTTSDYDDDGLYEGDVGELDACVAGAEQYHNQRVVFSFTPEGYDGGNEVHDLSALEPAVE